ncbi:MAG: Hsp20/alpha crystallin family protein [Haloferacaceae archaeon]
MPLPTNPNTSWMQGLDLPSRVLGGESPLGGTDYELYEEDDEFVLSVEAPGFEADEFEVAWDDGVLNVSAEHVDEERGRKRTYHRRFRFPKDVDDDEIAAQYRNGVLEVRLPLEMDATATGRTIPVES